MVAQTSIRSDEGRSRPPGCGQKIMRAYSTASSTPVGRGKKRHTRAAILLGAVHVAFWHNAEERWRLSHVRFSTESGHVEAAPTGRRSATCRHPTDYNVLLATVMRRVRGIAIGLTGRES